MGPKYDWVTSEQVDAVTVAPLSSLMGDGNIDWFDSLCLCRSGQADCKKVRGPDKNPLIEIVTLQNLMRLKHNFTLDS